MIVLFVDFRHRKFLFQSTSTRKLRLIWAIVITFVEIWQPTSTRKLRPSRCWMPTAQLSGNPHLRANCDLLIVALVGPFGLATHIYAQIATAGSLCFLLDRLLATHIYAQIATPGQPGIICGGGLATHLYAQIATGAGDAESSAHHTGNPHLRANCDLAMRFIQRTLDRWQPTSTRKLRPEDD